MSDAEADDDVRPIVVRPILVVEHHQRVKARNEMLPSHPFTWGIIGQPGSGKTHQTVSLCLQPDLYGGVWHNIYIISPTVKSDPLWTAIDDIPDSDKYTSYSDAAFEEILEKIRAEKRAYKDALSLIIVDDSMGERSMLKQDMSSAFGRFMLKYRHYNCSVILLSQHLGLIPKKMRSLISTWCFIGRVKRPTLESMVEDIDPELGDAKKAEAILLRAVGNDPHGFLFMSRDSPASPWVYRQGFGRRIPLDD
eukprot:TRINITY_DN6177_c0_g1_i3.p1 TRINITY_DN6177_c0_g1~~TRINITY_DN6177_c0_g1_i3.p1  ORF type:complete len:251 (+),score=33.54 TRINITY_DN6177_c0_g1_i3:207-959(+)